MNFTQVEKDFEAHNTTPPEEDEKECTSCGYPDLLDSEGFCKVCAEAKRNGYCSCGRVEGKRAPGTRECPTFTLPSYNPLEKKEK